MESTQSPGATDAAPAETGSPTRRQMLYAGVTVAAAAAGAGLAWWQVRDRGGEAGAAVNPALWSMEFDKPDGGRLAMGALRSRPLVINFWATWCPPCVEEMPLLDGFYRQRAANRFEMVGLAIDQPSAVRKFLARSPVSYPIGLAGLEGSELSRSLGDSVGALPFTVVIDASGQVRQRRMGRVTTADLQQWLAWFG